MGQRKGGVVLENDPYSLTLHDDDMYEHMRGKFYAGIFETMIIFVKLIID